MTTPAIRAVPRAGELDRDANGNPEGLRETTDPRWPVNTSTINSSQPVTAKVDQSNSGNVNHHLPWLIGLAVMATAALMGVLIMLWKGPEYLSALAEAKVSRAEALAELARKEASMAKDVVDVERAKTKAYEELKKELQNVRR